MQTRTQRVLICSFDVLCSRSNRPLGQQTQSTTTFPQLKKTSVPTSGDDTTTTTMRRNNPPSIPFIFIYFYLKSNKTINLILLVLLGNEHTVGWSHLPAAADNDRVISLVGVPPRVAVKRHHPPMLWSVTPAQKSPPESFSLPTAKKHVCIYHHRRRPFARTCSRCGDLWCFSSMFLFFRLFSHLAFPAWAKGFNHHYHSRIVCIVNNTLGEG